MGRGPREDDGNKTAWERWYREEGASFGPPSGLLSPTTQPRLPPSVRRHAPPAPHPPGGRGRGQEGGRGRHRRREGTPLLPPPPSPSSPPPDCVRVRRPGCWRSHAGSTRSWISSTMYVDSLSQAACLPACLPACLFACLPAAERRAASPLCAPRRSSRTAASWPSSRGTY